MAKARDRDKISLPTNTTDINTWRSYIIKIKEHEPIKRASCECLLVNGKSNRGRIGDLERFGLLEVIDGYVYVTDLGMDLLNLYNDSGECLVDEIEKTALMLKIFESWHVTNGGRDIHPGKIVIRLLSDPLMDGFISDHEFACFVENKDFKVDDQYEEIRDYILDFRNNTDGMCLALTKKSKSNIFLPTFVSNWEIFDKIIDIAIKYDASTDTFSLS